MKPSRTVCLAAIAAYAFLAIPSFSVRGDAVAAREGEVLHRYVTPNTFVTTNAWQAVSSNVYETVKATTDGISGQISSAISKFAETNSVLSGGPYQYALPYQTNQIPYSAIADAPPPTDLTPATNYANTVANDATNYTDKVAGEFEDGTRTVQQANFASEASTASEAANLGGYDGPHYIQESTNAADYAVIRLSQTNSVLSGGPYVTPSGMEDYVTNALSGIAADRITDGTNTIDAAGNVWEVGDRLGGWTRTQGPSDISVQWYNVDDQPPYTLAGEGWYFQGDNQWPQFVSSDKASTNLTAELENTAIYGEGVVSSFVRDMIKETNLVGRVALTNDIPPAVTVVAPSTNAAAGTAADAKATGTALYTGFTEWVFGQLPSGVSNPSVVGYGVYASNCWVLSIDYGGETEMYEAEGALDDLAVDFSTDYGLIAATRHLVTPTKTSQLVNDGSNGVPFANESAAVMWHDNVASNITVGPVNSIGSTSLSFSDSRGGNNLGDYGLTFGYNNYLGSYSSVFGNNNSVGTQSSAFGISNSAGSRSAVVGNNNHAGNFSYMFGYDNYARAEDEYGEPNGDDKHIVVAMGVGNWTEADGSFLMGVGHHAGGYALASFSLGTATAAVHPGAFVWSFYPTNYLDMSVVDIMALPKYQSHGIGSFNVNPVGGIGNFWIGDTNMVDHIAALTAAKVSANALASKPVYDFSKNADIIRAVADLVEALGGTVTNNPTANQGGN